jgi:hypothetical protein
MNPVTSVMNRVTTHRVIIPILLLPMAIIIRRRNLPIRPVLPTPMYGSAYTAAFRVAMHAE